MPEPACPAPHDYLAPLSSLNPFSSNEDKLEFLSDHFAWRLNVHSAFNPEFMNIDYKPELFKSPIIDDRDTGALVFEHLSVLSEECLSALLARLLLSVRGRTHGLHSCWLCACSCDYHYGRGTARRNPLPDYLRLLLSNAYGRTRHRACMRISLPKNRYSACKNRSQKTRNTRRNAARVFVLNLVVRAGMSTLPKFRTNIYRFLVILS